MNEMEEISVIQKDKKRKLGRPKKSIWEHFIEILPWLNVLFVL